MNWMLLGAAGLAALCLYLASPHQRLLVPAPRMPWSLRGLAVALCTGAVLLAGPAVGFWCAVFIAASDLMLALVALPFLDLWNRSRHVG